jgi:hypothetical protein
VELWGVVLGFRPAAYVLVFIAFISSWSSESRRRVRRGSAWSQKSGKGQSWYRWLEVRLIEAQYVAAGDGDRIEAEVESLLIFVGKATPTLSRAEPSSAAPGGNRDPQKRRFD